MPPKRLKALKGDASASLAAASLYLFCSKGRVTVSLRSKVETTGAGQGEWCWEGAFRKSRLAYGGLSKDFCSTECVEQNDCIIPNAGRMRRKNR